ncbi:MAG: hypothetical protein BWY09_01810 [Candidatus Hydrogenedentes bacterium ADurb.Bin179]|nr:MAG: hypothetical protein BWY09_01810 [Candidatus Hydrogenedentes bacterium ADurb.Bin179]
MNRLEILYKQRELLKRQITGNLDFLMGTVTAKGPNTYGHNLTTKVDGKSISWYIPKALLETVRVMNQRHLDVRALMVELSRVNWEILKLEVPEKGVAGRRPSGSRKA